jgi:hypothetical protein
MIPETKSPESNIPTLGHSNIPTPPSSMLDQIIATARENSPEPSVDGLSQLPPTSPDLPPNPPQKPRDPLTASMVLRIIGSLLIVAVIFFGSFLAYIVFNPDQAAFFVNIFGINPSDIKDLLKRLINGSFGIMVLILSIAWIVSLFRAIWTPREQRRRRMIGWLTASIVGILLFSILALWAYLFRVIKDTAFDNLSGSVTMYDNDIYTHIQTYPDASQYASLPTTTNLV